ncbi:hypothetical protein ACWIYZ_07970 [Ursidibacter arcticus]
MSLCTLEKFNSALASKIESPRLSDYMQFFNEQAESIADYGVVYDLAKI